MEKKSLVWDCGSSLYDSVELKSFQRQLDSAIVASRTLSMPHLSHSDPRPLQVQPPPIKRSSSPKIFRSLQKLVRWVFRSNPVPGSLFRSLEKGQAQQRDGSYAFNGRRSDSDGLSTIPEMGFHDTLRRRTASERFTLSGPVGISFA